MAYDNTIPVFGFAPNWEQGVLERFEWKTRILEGQTGIEQRQALRLSPRKSLEFTIFASGTQRMAMDAYLTGRAWQMNDVKAGLVYVPLWHQQTVISADIAPGAVGFGIDTLRAYEYAAGGGAIIYDPETGVSAGVAVSAVNTGTNTVTLTVTGNWSKGCIIAPLKLARLEGAPAFTKKSARLYEAPVRLNVAETNDHAVLSTGAVVNGAEGAYNGVMVLGMEPDASESMTETFDRLFYALDNGKAIPRFTSKSLYSFSTVQQSYRMFGPAAYADFVNLLYHLQGRIQTVWVPTFMQDLDLVKDVNNSLTMTVAAAGLTGLIPNNDRTHIRIERTDGSSQYAEIASVADSLPYQVLTLKSAVTVLLSDVIRISFMSLKRQDQDSVEVKHVTDISGVATSALTFKTVYPPPFVAPVGPHTQWQGQTTGLWYDTIDEAGVNSCGPAERARQIANGNGGQFSVYNAVYDHANAATNTIYYYAGYVGAGTIFSGLSTQVLPSRMSP